MFTGIVEEIGVIQDMQVRGSSGSILIRAKDVMAETMRRSSLSVCHPGDRVNLERAMAANGRFGGHIVSGHIDGTGRIQSIRREENAVWVTTQTTPQILNYIVEKGSIAIDGISLTVAYVDQRVFKVSVIPHTGQETTLLTKLRPAPSQRCDSLEPTSQIYTSELAYQQASAMQHDSLEPTGLTMEMLLDAGF